LRGDPVHKPVWSPDSKTLLINTLRDPDTGIFNIHMLDVATGKATKKFKNVAPVYAWVTSDPARKNNSFPIEGSDL
jgi:hypothetical protein